MVIFVPCASRRGRGVIVNSIAGDLERISLSELRPDWRNPRFPSSATARFRTDVDVYAYLDKQFDAAAIAESISRHGFFLSEPLIAIPDDGSQNELLSQPGSEKSDAAHRRTYIVVEGNRRLAALQGLASSAVRQAMTDPRWRTFPRETELPTSVPVLVAPSREHVAPILGYRHVTGIAPWDPYQQARYVASLIDDEDSSLSAADVAQLIGRNVSEVRSFYRNYSIVEQARDVFEMKDPDRIVDEFGVWTRAMTSSPLRDYINAPPPRDVEEGRYPLPDDGADSLQRLVTWIFGEPRSDEDREAGRQSKEGRVISDSRQLSRLGRALAHPRGIAALESGASLADAETAALDESVRFAEALVNARKGLATAAENATADRVEDNRGVLAEIAEYVRSIKATL